MTREVDELALRVKAGEVSAWKELVERMTRRLMAMAFRYTADWETACDLTQDTWLKTIRSIRRYDPSQPLEHWVAAIHRNGCVSYLRRAARYGARFQSASPSHDPVDPTAPSPAQSIEAKEFYARLSRAMMRLSPRQLDVFTVVDINETDQETASRLLGMKPVTVRTTLHAARRRLASLLGRD